LCYVLLAATAPRAVTSRSCEVVRYSRATRGDENARAGRGEDARGGEVRAAGCFALGLTRRARIVTLAHAGPATVGARPDGEAEDEDELHGLLALCGNQPVIGCGESPATTRPSSTPPRRRRRKTAAPAPTQTWAPRRWRGGRRNSCARHSEVIYALLARDAEFWLRRKRNRWVCGRAAPLNRWSR